MTHYLLYLLIGTSTGILAGMLGVGGGIIVVPMLNVMFSHQHFPPELIMHMAVGTSFAIMIFTAMSSAYAFHRRGLIVWPLFYKFIPGLLAGTVAGSLIAKQLSSAHLRFAFGIFMILIAMHLFFQKVIPAKAKLPHWLTMVVVAFAIGIQSGFFGVGGGMLMVPFFIYCNLETHKAMGTSALCGFPLAIIGTISLIATGWTTAILHAAPPGSTGYVYWPAAIVIACASLLFAPLGTRLAVALPGQVLKKIFAVVLVITAVNLLV